MSFKNILLVAPPVNTKINKWLGKNVSHLKVLKSCYFGNKCQSFIGENLGLHSIAAFLSQFEFEIEVLDSCLHELPIDMVCQKILKIQPDIVALSVMEETIDEIAMVSHTLRENGFEGQLIAGGPMAILAPQYVHLRIPELNNVVSGDLNELASILGIKNKKYSTSFRDRPFPTREDSLQAINKGFAIGVWSSRGCSYGKCNFCSPAAISRRVGYHREERSVDSVVEEVLFLDNKYKPEWITFSDEDFIGNSINERIRAWEIANNIAKSGISANLMIDCRVDQIEPRLFSKLRQAGLKRVFIGVEHHSNKSLKCLNKGITNDNICNSLRLLKSLDIDIIAGYITFLPWESQIETLEALDFYRSIDSYDLGRLSTYLRNYKGTPNGIKNKKISSWYDSIFSLSSIYTKYVILKYLELQDDIQVVPINWIRRFGDCHFEMMKDLILTTAYSNINASNKIAKMSTIVDEAICKFDTYYKEYQSSMFK